MLQFFTGAGIRGIVTDMDRREAISTITGLGLALAGEAETTSKGMPYRQFGKTGEKVSAIGLGGYRTTLSLAFALYERRWITG